MLRLTEGGGVNHKPLLMLMVDSCCRLFRFEFFHGGVKVGRSVVRATDRFDMTAIAERAAAVQASLFDDVVHVVDERGPAIPARLNIAGRTDNIAVVKAVTCVPYGAQHLVMLAGTLRPCSFGGRLLETCRRRPDAP